MTCPGPLEAQQLADINPNCTGHGASSMLSYIFANSLCTRQNLEFSRKQSISVPSASVIADLLCDPLQIPCSGTSWGLRPRQSLLSTQAGGATAGQHSCAGCVASGRPKNSPDPDLFTGLQQAQQSLHPWAVMKVKYSENDHETQGTNHGKGASSTDPQQGGTHSRMTQGTANGLHEPRT